MRTSKLEEWLNSPQYEAKLTDRLIVLKNAEENVFKRYETLIKCTEDPIYFIENFCWFFEPRNLNNPDIEAFLFDYQKEMINDTLSAEMQGEDRLWEKSRDMGFTWMSSMYFLWRWLFTKGWIGLFGSRKQEEVDNHCYSDDTEVLTKDGWKFFRDVDIDKDLFATRSKDKEFEWQKSHYKHHTKYNGDFYHIHSRTLDLMVSPNHRVLYRNNPWALIRDKYESNERIAKAEELYKRGDSLITIPATSNWKGKEIDNISFGDISMSGDDFCAFMGMWLAEGSKGQGNGIVISQRTFSKGFNHFKNILSKIFGTYKYYNNTNFIVRNKKLREYLTQFGLAENKFIPEIIMSSTPKQLNIFLYYYMLGDGSWLSAQPTMGTVSRKMADQLQEVIQKIGFSASIQKEIRKKDIVTKDGRIIKKENCLPFYRLNIRSSRYQTMNITKTHYDGDIWCVSVPNEILYVRRNGKPAWCGNTMSSFFGKVRYNLYRLPKFLLPNGFRKKVNDTEGKLVNPALNSLIQGESSNPNFGRDRRSSIAIMDELFLQEYAQDSWRNLAETSKSRIGISTPKPTRFAKNLKEGMNTNGWLRSQHWSSNPFKDQQWYEHEKKRYEGDEIGLKQELEMEYLVDPSILVYPQAELIKMDTVEYNESLPLHLSMDWGVSPSQTVFLWWQKHVNTWVLLEAVDATEKEFGWYMPFLCPNVDISMKYYYNSKEQDVLNKVRKWRKPTFFYGEPAHQARSMTTATSVSQELSKEPYKVMLRINGASQSHEKRQVAVKELIRRGIIFNDTYYTARALDALTMSKFPKTIGTRDNCTPLHDDNADYRAAVENFAINVITSTSKIISKKYG